jgi:predicted NAD-dependent protein-ADP-ribosyltransferase YbiA (DUF1768 family)
MVYSNINSTVFYKETPDIDPEDIDHEALLYELDIHRKQILVVLGKAKHTFIRRNIIYFPVYLVTNGIIKARIGVIEIPKNSVLELTDDDGDIDVEQLNKPLYFEFANEKYIDRNGMDSNVFIKKGDKLDENESEEDVEESESDDEIDEMLSVKVKPSKMSKEAEKATTTLQDGIFKVDTKVKIPVELVEESESDAKQIKKDYQHSKKNVWVETFLKNNNYDIHDVENNGDCFFAVIRDAFKQIGQITTVAKLRAILAKEVTDEIFQEHRLLFNDMDGTIREYEREIKEIKHLVENVLSKRAKKEREDKESLKHILEESKRLKLDYKLALKNKQNAQEILSENVGDFSSIDTLEKFREYIQTTRFWADSWAISVLERVLKIKMIILSQRAYIDNDFDGIMMCGEIDPLIQREGVFRPKHYIMTTFSGDHFQLITYKNKRIFDFHEIPYHIKSLIMNKCLERSSGSFYVIPEMRNLKTRMGIDEDEGKPSDDLDETSSEYNSKMIFAFYKNSSKTSKPGKGTKEKIPADKQSTFLELGRIPDWRRKLDDSWTEAHFTLDKHEWASVEHYYQSAKFKKRNPKFAAMFSLDEPSEFSEDAGLAKIAGSRNAKVKKGVLLRPKTIEIDPDFYDKRHDNERLDAMRAKFGQNEDLKQLLLSTRDAKLIQLHHGTPAEIDHMLMSVRRELESAV